MVTIYLTYLNSEFYFTTNLFKIQDAISNPRITLNGNPQKPSNTKVKNTEIGKKDKKKILKNIIQYQIRIWSSGFGLPLAILS